MSSFHFQIIALKNSHSEFLPFMSQFWPVFRRMTHLSGWWEKEILQKAAPHYDQISLLLILFFFFKERHLHSCLLSHQVKASPSHEVLTVLGRDGAPPYQQARARQIGSGTISKSLPRTSITSRRKRPPSLVSEENCKKSRSAVSHNHMNGIKFIHQ